ncbi:hypothetical protein MHTCC0001_21840 [Flavobacteriaceae bacterium MHTCC 0001]
MSSIEWTQKTWNPTTGCTKISKECDNCYAEKETNRHMHNPKLPMYKAGFDVVVEHPNALSKPYKLPSNEVIFVNSMSDLFHKDITLDFIKQVFKVMNETPQHTYQILTKRDNILLEYSNELTWTDNIWMGVSVGSQVSVRKIDRLKQCGSKYKFLSIEPLIEDIADYDLNGIDWVIVGGESGGNKARPIQREWIESIRLKCLETSTPFFFKQWGSKKFNPDPNDPTTHKMHRYYSKGGCLLDGELHWNNPSNMKQIEVPKIKVFDNDYMVMDEVGNKVTIWELKSYLPFPSDETYNNLKTDIKKNGINDPILFWRTENSDELIIEGHTRIRASIEARINIDKIPFKEVTEKFKSLDEIKLWMVKHQLNRRNLSTTERVILAYNSKGTIESIAKRNLSIAGRFKGVDRQIDTHAEIAKIAGVSKSTVTRFVKVVDSENKVLIDKLRKGNISINLACNQVKEPKEKTDKKPLVEKLTITEFNNLDEAQNALDRDEVDVIMISKSKDVKTFLKSSNKARIGIVVRF